MSALPGWLMHRARTGGFSRVHVLLAPVGERSSAIYLLEKGTPGGDHVSTYELHAVDDASDGTDGCTIPLTRTEAYKLLSAMAGAFTGRHPGEEVVPLKTDSPSGEFHDGTPLAARTGPLAPETAS